MRDTIFLTAALLLATSSAQADSTIPCKGPPDAGSFVAVRAGAQVSTTQDTQRKTCTFSVNGAVATSPPPLQVLKALEQYRDGAMPWRDKPWESMAALMAAAAPVDEVPRELVDTLHKYEGPLASCLVEFFGKRVLPTERSDYDKVFSCRGIERYANHDDKVQRLESDGVAVEVRTLMLRVRWNGGRYLSTVWLPLPD